MATGAAAADGVLQESLQRARQLLLDAPGTEVLELLERADRRLKKRLVGIAGGTPSVRFSDAQAMAYAKQIDVTIRYVKKRLLGITHDKAKASISESVRVTARDLGRLNEAFTGVATPLRLRQAGTMAGVVKRTEGALLPQRATSVDRYGVGMTRDFRKIIRDGLIQGASQGQMVDALVGHGGPRGPKVSLAAREDPATGKVIRLKEEAIPEGLFVRKKYWAERVVRTEVAHGQNEARLRTIEESKQTDFPDMGKKILAMMDMRTAMDSIGVHGQVRPTDGLFQDGAGRQYQRPPARPNDRETIVPWRLSWEETPYSAPMPPAEVAELQAAKEAPGKAKQVKIRQATKVYEAQLTRRAAQAARNVHRMIGEQLGGQIGPAIAAQNVTELKAATATAKAQQRAAQERVKAAQVAATTKAAATAQTAATAAGKVAADVRERMARGRADARAYRRAQAAAERGRIVQAAQREVDEIRASVRGVVQSGLGAPVLRRIQQLAVDDPVGFGELYNQTVKGGEGLPARFFQSLAKSYKRNAQAIAVRLGVWTAPD